MSNAPQNKNHQSLYTTRTNKISSTLSVMDPLKLQQQQQQSESMLTNRQSHRKYKLSHSQITKIDKMSREGLLRWKESRQSQDEGNGNYYNNNNNNSNSNSKADRSNNTKSKTSFTIATTNNNNTKNNFKQQQKIIRKSFAFNEGNNNNSNKNNSKQKQHPLQQQDNIIPSSDNETNGVKKRDDNKHIRRSISSRNSHSNNGDNNIHSNSNKQKSKSKMDKSLQQRQHHKQLRKITQNTTSMHSIINYKLKKDRLMELLQDQSMTLHVQVIEFDLGKREREREKRRYFGDNQDDDKDDENQNDNQNDDKIKFKNFEQHELYQSRKLQKSQQQKQQKSLHQHNIIEVICFQIHNKQTNMHYRSQFTYKTLGKDVKFVFENIQELFEYVTTTAIGQSQQQNSMIVFNQQTMQLQVRIQFMRTGQQQQKQQQSMKPIKKSKKIIKFPLLPFAMIEIIQHHPHQIQQQKQKKQLLLEIKQLKRDLELSRNLVHALRDQNDKLKLKLNKEKIEAEKEKAHKEMIIESYQKLSKVSQKPNKEYYFQFVPDMKAKNFNNFTFKNNILKKVKNDLKWDQVSSEAPLPKAGRHYFSFLIKDFMPDFMFGIVTMKGKDTSNAFLGLETICLYASKNNCYIYERGKHYKISVNVKRNDVVFVIIDRQKNVIEWVKKKSTFGNSKQGSPKSKDYQQKFLIQPHMDHKTSLASITPVQQQLTPRHTQDDMPIQNPHYLHNNQYRHRKTSQTISSTQFPINQLSAISILPLTTAIDYYQTQQIDYIHSTILPEQMVQKQLYGYLEVYNVNQPLKMNERK